LVNDGLQNSELAVVVIGMPPVNDALVADPHLVKTQQSILVPITLRSADIVGDELANTVSTPPIFGILSGIIPNLTHTPDHGYIGNDRFSFYVNNGEFISIIA
jgi:hypothetical protein